MIFKTVGEPKNPSLILLHGGGLSSWSWDGVVPALQKEFYVITPILDGHGQDGNTLFTTIEAAAQTILTYINENCQGRVFAIAGLSVGAQIATEVLARQPQVASYAVLESALVCPIPGIKLATKPMYHLCYGLIKQKWFAKLQATALSLPQNMFEDYYQDSLRMSKQSLINLSLSNGSYQIPQNISKTHAHVLIIAGQKEVGSIKKSAKRLHQAIPTSRLLMAKGLKHGQLSLMYCQEYVQILQDFFAENAIQNKSDLFTFCDKM